MIVGLLNIFSYFAIILGNLYDVIYSYWYFKHVYLDNLASTSPKMYRYFPRYGKIENENTIHVS